MARDYSSKLTSRFHAHYIGEGIPPVAPDEMNCMGTTDSTKEVSPHPVSNAPLE